MPAQNKTFPWMAYYGHYNYFEKQMNNHNNITRWEMTPEGLYKVHRNHQDILNVFICECYIYGVAEYTKTIDEIGPIDCIVINSMWCSFTNEVKRICRNKGVLLCKITDFMGAMNFEEYSAYLSIDEKKKWEEKGWI